MSSESRKYWFPAKRRGWGWGPPTSTPGRVFLAIWVLVVVSASPFLVQRSFALFMVFSLAMVSFLMLVCFLKGEPPRWRS